MADTVTTRVLRNDGQSNKYVVHLTNVSDGVGEAAVVKVDISTLAVRDGIAGGPTKVCTYTAIEKIEYNVNGMTVTLAWDHTADDTIAVLGAAAGAVSGCLSFEKEGGLVDPKSAGGTGDIVLTTTGQALGDTYDIKLYVKLKA